MGQGPGANHRADDALDAQVDHLGRNSNLQGGVTDLMQGMTPPVLRALASARDTCAANSQPNDADPTPTPGPPMLTQCRR